MFLLNFSNCVDTLKSFQKDYRWFRVLVLSIMLSAMITCLVHIHQGRSSLQEDNSIDLSYSTVRHGRCNH